jgi:CAAX protease family protein
MRGNPVLPIVGALVAIAITTFMDLGGYSDFSALPLGPLLAAFWYLDRLTRRDAGFVQGRRGGYGLAVIHPLAVMGAIGAVAAASGALDLSHTDWSKAALNLVIMTLLTILVAMITEEGFFRGWLWGSLTKRGLRPGAVLVATSIAFAAWHISVVMLPTGFEVPPRQAPIFLANAALLGAIWGMLRWRSGSVLAASVGHGLWNGLAYILFGFGTREGALGIQDTPLFGPEVGLLGLGLNAAFLAILWWGFKGPAETGP